VAFQSQPQDFCKSLESPLALGFPLLGTVMNASNLLC
jgi:hypothetical protein